MTELFVSPGCYIQEKGVIQHIGRFALPLGQRPFVLGDETVLSAVKGACVKSFSQVHLIPRFELFGGECCWEEIHRLVSLVREAKVDVIVGTGGGKALDTAKTVAWHTGLPIVTVPTSAATCSAWSNISPVYTPDGLYIKTLNLDKNPDVALVDSEIIAQAPVRLLCAGMGDSLAKWYEAGVSTQKIEIDSPTEIALSLAEMTREKIFRHGLKAKEDADRNLCSQQLEEITYNNILITGLIGGLGGEKCRSAAAHAINYGIRVLEPARHSLHGEIVSFGIVVQLIMERKNASSDQKEMIDQEIEKLMKLYSDLELPLTLSEIGLSDFDSQQLKVATRKICKKGSSIHRLPFPVNEEMVYDALLETDKRGKEFKRMHSNEVSEK
jgi:glycerol dehydrogenase